jgi:two-component system nitrate/nitrite sensor histidine kinase NarX
MKIQVSRMQAVLGKPERGAEMGVMLGELREGLSGAYRQLRELLSTFRLKMEGGDLRGALASTVEEFAERGGIDIRLEVDPGLGALSPNEEIHILHIVREALSNVLNHSRADHAEVRVARSGDGMVEACVEDDGIGISKSADAHHYGMTIMEERARTLRGEIGYLPGMGGGCRVVLRFRPASQRTIPIINKAAA